MTPANVHGTSKFKEDKIPENSWNFFLKMRHFEKKNLPKFKNDFKWPTFKAIVKT